MYASGNGSRSGARRTTYRCRGRSTARHTTSTMMRLVLPETSHGTPAVMTMQSPDFAYVRLRMRSRTTASMASYPGTWSTRTGITPHTRASWRYVAGSVVTARIGTGGRSAATFRAVNPPLVIRFADEPLLHQRHPLERQLDAEVTTRHHDGVGDRHNSVEVVQRGRLFDLGDQLDGRRNKPSELFDILRTTDEREREVIHPDLHGILNVLPVLFGQRRRRHLHAGQIHPLVRRQNPAVDHPAADPGR